MLIARLPPESLTLTAIRDGLTPERRAELAADTPSGHGPWSHQEMLLATIADRVAHQTWVLGEWKTPPPRPEPIPRPGVGDTSAGKTRVSTRTVQIAEALRAGLPIPPPDQD